MNFKITPLFLSIIFTISLCFIVPSPTSTSPKSLTFFNTTNEMNGISPYADNIGWKYTFINGKLYRRLYNFTKNVWIGNWELCP